MVAVELAVSEVAVVMAVAYSAAVATVLGQRVLLAQAASLVATVVGGSTRGSQRSRQPSCT